MQELFCLSLLFLPGLATLTAVVFTVYLISNGINIGQPDDSQIDCVTKIAPLVAMFAGHPDLLFHVEDVIRMTQDNDIAVTIGLAAARYNKTQTCSICHEFNVVNLVHKSTNKASRTIEMGRTNKARYPTKTCGQISVRMSF